MPSGKRALLYRVIDGVEHKRCPTCLQFKPHTPQYFYRKPGNGGLYAYCRACHSTASMTSRGRRLVLAAGMVGAV